MKTIVILLAGGCGSRMGTGRNKVLLNVCGKTVIRRSIEAFSGKSDDLMIVCRPEDKAFIEMEVNLAHPAAPVHYTFGGETRQESVLNGLRAVSAEKEDIILIHDAARCFADKDLIGRVIESVSRYGTGIPGIPVTSTYKICDDHSQIVSTPERSHLFEIQTPQGFLFGTIRQYAEKAASDLFTGTDDASLLEHYGIPVRVVPGSSENIKLTNPQDLKTAQAFLKGECQALRIGMGYDVHQLTEGRKLILCGVEIPYEKGLMGHSDADVALHALMDAMLGACSLGDIGSHFPDTDARYKDISSTLLLAETVQLLEKNACKVTNADITIVAQKPKLLPFIRQMVKNVSSALGLSEDRISIKATTTEHLGFEGRMEGISCYAVCMVDCMPHFGE